MRFCWFVVGAFALLSGCSSTGGLGGAPGLKVLENTTLPPPAVADFLASESPYLIGPFDQLTIEVVGLGEGKPREIQVDASGRISFPYVGEVAVAGRSPKEVEDAIEDGLRRSYFRAPLVTVNLKEAQSQMVTVEGDVKQPGIYPVVRDMTLLRALAAAKGTTDTSRLNNVVVFRTVNSEKFAALYNVKMIRQGVYADPAVYANDLVVVSDSRARKLFKDFLQLAPLLSAPLIVALQNN